MSILEQINKKIVELYKSGGEERRILYQTLKSELLSATKDKKSDLNEQEEINVLKKELKLRSEALAQFKTANRQDLIKNTEAEVSEIKGLLPEDLSTDEIRKAVQAAISSSSDKNFGNIMKQSMEELKGMADGKIVSEIVKEELGKQ